MCILKDIIQDLYFFYSKKWRLYQEMHVKNKYPGFIGRFTIIVCIHLQLFQRVVEIR